MRTKIYDVYQGKQWIFNSVATGLINDQTSVSQVLIDPSYESHMMTFLDATLNYSFAEFCCIPSIFIVWFKQLEIHCSNNQLFFRHFVDFNQVASQKEKLTLTSFNQVNPEYFNNANWQHVKNKEK